VGSSVDGEQFGTLNQAVSGTKHPTIIWRVQQQQWCLITAAAVVPNCSGSSGA